MSDTDSCPYCGSDIDQNAVLQVVIDQREDGQVDWLQAKRILQEWEAIQTQGTPTLSGLKTHLKNHVETIGGGPA